MEFCGESTVRTIMSNRYYFTEIIMGGLQEPIGLDKLGKNFRLLFYSRILMHSANNSNKSTYYSKDRFNIDQIVTFTRKILSFPAIVMRIPM